MRLILLLCAFSAATTTATLFDELYSSLAFVQPECMGLDVYKPGTQPHVGIVGCGFAGLSAAFEIITTPGNKAHVKVFCDGIIRKPDPVTPANYTSPPKPTSTWWIGDGSSPALSRNIEGVNGAYSRERNPLIGQKGSYVPRPKWVSGQALFNGQVTSSGTCKYYDEWGVYVGAPNLINCATMKQITNKREKWVGADPYNWHSTEGPMTFTAKDVEPQTQAIRDAFITSTGSFFNPDINGPNGDGFGNAVRNYRETNDIFYREDPWSAFGPILSASPYFELVTAVDVHDIIWDSRTTNPGNTPLARGLGFFSQKNKKYYKQCFRDVVAIAGGTKPTLEFLLRNGVGPKTDLAEHGITSRADLPVGTNLWNQLQITMAGLLRTFTPDPRTKGSGTMGTYYSSRALARGENRTDFMNAIVRSNLTLNATGGVTGVIYAVIAQMNRYDVRGWLKLNSPLYGVEPEFTFNFFQGVDGLADASTMVELLKRTRAAIGAAGMIELAPGFTTVPATAPDSVWLSWLYANHEGNWHIGGGANMAPPSDPLAVVDSHFRVYKTDNLHVWDSSTNTLQHDKHAAAHTAMVTGGLGAKIAITDHPVWH